MCVWGKVHDTNLIYRVRRAIAMEVRAKFNISVARNQRERYQGLTFWTPNVNIFRDPRWGRGQETYGEDPFLTARIGVAFVKGLQGNHPRYLQAAGMAKHYAVHSGPEELRHEFNAEASKKDMWETYLPAFKARVTEANVEGVMGAYNRTNGDPCCGHPYLMQEVLQKQWGFKGYYVSDCWAIVDFYKGHKIVEGPAEAAAMALNAGTNLNCGSTYPELLKSVQQGLTSEDQVDKNLRELLPTRFKLGLFEPEGMVPFDTIGASWIRKKEHVDLSLEAAEKSLVLLKNENNVLPIDPNVNRVFVTGPTAAHIQALLANYYGVSEDLTTILEGVVEVVQLYITDEEASVPVPQYALKGFQRVALEPGEARKLTFEVSSEDLELVNFAGERVLEPGSFRISVGGSVPSQRSLDLGAPQYQQAQLNVLAE